MLRALEGKIEADGTLADDASPELARIRRALERQHRQIQDSLRRSLRAIAEQGAAQEEPEGEGGGSEPADAPAEGEREAPPVTA